MHVGGGAGMRTFPIRTCGAQADPIEPTKFARQMTRLGESCAGL